LFPYLAAVVAFIGIVFSARRWSRHAAAPTSGDTAVDPVLNARLDDELQNLD
jgi:hypothetical protein